MERTGKVRATRGGRRRTRPASPGRAGVWISPGHLQHGGRHDRLHISIVEGDIDHVLSGKDLFSPASPIAFSQLDPSTLVWLTEHGYEDPGRRVVVTPVGRDPEGSR
ncbi:hypothetical protein ACFQX6_43650 [Streptosporangium lutulentum]